MIRCEGYPVRVVIQMSQVFWPKSVMISAMSYLSHYFGNLLLQTRYARPPPAPPGTCDRFVICLEIILILV